MLTALLAGGVLFPSMIEDVARGATVRTRHRVPPLYYSRDDSGILVAFSPWRNSSSVPLSISIPKPFDELEKDRQVPYFGDLFIDIFEEDGMRRAIYHDFRLDKRKKKSIDSADVDQYYAFDDDAKRNPYTEWDDDSIQDRKRCRRTSWHRDLPINCNTVHEMDLELAVVKSKLEHIGEGAYRDVYAVGFDNDTTVVFKDFGIDAKFDYADLEYMRMDSIVAERLSWSPLIVDIYGFCALGHIGEYMPAGELESKTTIGRKRVHLNDKDHLDPRNKFTPTQKLNYALEMAEAVLLLHSWPDGVIVHDDIQLTQYLLTPDGHLKLNDFNRAEIMLWNEKDQEYCKYKNHPGHGDVSAKWALCVVSVARYMGSELVRCGTLVVSHSHWLWIAVAGTGRIL